jgi:hypothetical protein
MTIPWCRGTDRHAAWCYYNLVGIHSFGGQIGGFRVGYDNAFHFSQFVSSYNLLFANAAVIMIPALFMFLFFQWQIVAGATGGAVNSKKPWRWALIKLSISQEYINADNNY